MDDYADKDQRPYNPVRIEVDDDIASIHGKVESSPDDIVVLSVANGARRLRDPLVLRMLRRFGERGGKEVVIVTSDGIIRSLAQTEGFRTWPSLKALDRKWAKLLSGSRFTREDFAEVGHLLALVIGGLIVGGGAAFFVTTFLMPSATVVIKPTSEIASASMSITARTEVKSADYGSSEIPGRAMEAPIDVNSTIDTTGQRIEADKAARGSVSFVNRSYQKLLIHKGTQVGTSAGVRFLTDADLTLNPTPGTRASVSVTAQEPGSAGNVKASAIDRIFDGQLALQALVTNEKPMEGGAEKNSKVVTERDQANLMDKVKQEALEAAIKQLNSEKKPEESIYPQTVEVEIASAEYDPQIGDFSPVLKMKARFNATGTAFVGSDVNKLVSQKLVETAGGGQIQANSMRVSPLEAYAWQKGEVSFHVFGQGRLRPILKQGDIKDKLVGMTKDEAESYLMKNIQLSSAPVIKIYPGWATTLPRLGFRIDLQVSFDQ